MPITARNGTSHQPTTAPISMSVMEFEEFLDRGIPAADLDRFAHTRISAYESLPDYVNFLRSLGAIRLNDDGRFVRS
jgi:hypothetical protein